MPSPRFLLLALLALPLAACHSRADDAAATAVEQVQQGTVSDSMLPLDKVTSEPPLAPEAAASSSAGSKTGGAAKSKATPGKAAADAPAAAASDVAPADSGD